MTHYSSSQHQERGCWTCRARRKRCDGRLPLCDTCKRLGIACSGFNSTKPRWMDGGTDQQEYCNGLKKIIKRNRTRSVTSISSSTTPSSSSFETPRQFGKQAEISEIAEYGTSSALEFTDLLSGLQTPPLFLDSTSCFSSETTSTDSFPTTPAAVFQDAEFMQMLDSQQSWMYQMDTPPISECREQNYDESTPKFPEFEARVAPMYATPLSIEAPLEMDIGDDSPKNDSTLDSANFSMVVRYMDTTFYNIFPYLCRTTNEAERGWLLSMILNFVSVRASVLSIENFTRCQDFSKAEIVDETLEDIQFLAHYKSSLEKYDEEVNTLLHQADTLSNKIRDDLVGRILVCTVHYIYLEQTLGAPVIPKNNLLAQAKIILNVWAKENSSSSEDSQKGISLFAGIISQWIATSQASTDAHNHEIQDETHRNPNSKLTKLTTNPITPCPERILSVITSINSLSRWKIQCSQAGMLSMLNLARRADAIEQEILTELALQEKLTSSNSPKSSHTDRSCTSRAPRRYNNSSDSGSCTNHKTLLSTTALLFAHAARIYLHVILSGANPRVNEIKKSVKRALRVLKEFETEDLDLVVWPLVVTGSMLGSETEGEVLGREWMMERVAELVAEGIGGSRWAKIGRLLKECWEEDEGGSRAAAVVDCSWTWALKMLGWSGELLV